MSKILFTSESVTEGHPDKICDKISDAILDAMLAEDPQSRVACETFTTTGLIMIMGEVTTKAKVDVTEIARKTVEEIGYDRAKYGFDCHTCAVLNSLHQQSPDIALGVDKCAEAKAGEQSDGLDTGAGDQGLMFGYACDETPELMPLPISLAHKLALRLTEVRKNGTLDYLRPDGKTQVTVEYDDGKPVRIDAIVVSSQHSDEVSLDKIRTDVIEQIIKPIIPASMMDEQTKAEKIMTTKEKADYSELYQAINALKEELRLPVILYYIEDFNIREIAQILDITEGAVQKRLARARGKLRCNLRESEAAI